MYPLFQSAGQLQYGWTPGCEPQAPVWECGVLCAAVQLLPANLKAPTHAQRELGPPGEKLECGTDCNV